MITWNVRDQGFDMACPARARTHHATLKDESERPRAAGVLRGKGLDDIDLWAVHAGGRTVLDAVEAGLQLKSSALDASRAVLNDYGNMSSATVMFVLQQLQRTAVRGARGLAMAFGPGMVAETFRFRMAN